MLRVYKSGLIVYRCRVLWVCAELPTASRRNDTGELGVLSGTHLCDDSPRQGGEPSERYGSCSVVKGAIFDHTPSAEHTCRGFRRLEYHFLSKHLPSICARAL